MDKKETYFPPLYGEVDCLGWKSRQRVHTNLLNRKTGL